MKYFADCLTSLRYGLAIAVFNLGLHGHLGWATVLFAAGILTDVIDGTAARRWPYPAGETHWWRKDPHAFDNLADLALWFAAAVLVALSWPVWWILIGLAVVQNRIGAWLIRRSDSSRAEKIDVINGWVYGATILVTLIAMTWLTAPRVWIPMGCAYVLAAGIIVVVKWDRATSRPEITYPRRS